MLVALVLAAQVSSCRRTNTVAFCTTCQAEMVIVRFLDTRLLHVRSSFPSQDPRGDRPPDLTLTLGFSFWKSTSTYASSDVMSALVPGLSNDV